MSVLNDTAVELIDVFEALVLEVGAGFFAADSTGAIKENFLVFFALENFFY